MSRTRLRSKIRAIRQARSNSRRMKVGPVRKVSDTHKLFQHRTRDTKLAKDTNRKVSFIKDAAIATIAELTVKLAVEYGPIVIRLLSRL